MPGSCAVLVGSLVVLVGVGGCAPIVAPEAGEPPCRYCEETREASRLGPGDEDGHEGASRGRTVGRARPPEDRFATTRIGASAADSRGARPPRRRAIDVELVRAPFADAVRFLAESGRFDVVIEAPAAGEVTVSLHRVDPFDALEVIAEAKGLAVRMRRGVVIVAP